jgi:hypothetical protein
MPAWRPDTPGLYLALSGTSKPRQLLISGLEERCFRLYYAWHAPRTGYRNAQKTHPLRAPSAGPGRERLAQRCLPARRADPGPRRPVASREASRLVHRHLVAPRSAGAGTHPNRRRGRGSRRPDPGSGARVGPRAAQEACRVATLCIPRETRDLPVRTQSYSADRSYSSPNLAPPKKVCSAARKCPYDAPRHGENLDLLRRKF